MKAEKVHFKIEGSFITDFCRTRVLEGAWRHAVHVLKECIVGSDLAIVDQILTCKKRFTGINNLKLVNEDQSRDEVVEYKKTLKFQYGGMLYAPGSSIYWQPYAVISSLGPNDLGHNEAREHRDFPVPVISRAWAGIKRSNRKGYESAMYYAENQGDVAALLVVNKEDKWVLWTKVQDPPLFVKSFSPADGAQKALDAWLKLGHRLDCRGHKEWFESTKKSAAKKSKKKVKKKPKKVASWHVSDLEKIATCESGWLDRRGRFYRCAYMEHIGMATEICEKLLGRSQEDGSPYNHELHLETLGWCKLKHEAGPTYWRWWPGNPGKKKLTQSQCDVILYWFAKQGKEIPSYLEGKLEDTE